MIQAARKKANLDDGDTEPELPPAANFAFLARDQLSQDQNHTTPSMEIESYLRRHDIPVNSALALEFSEYIHALDTGNRIYINQVSTPDG